MSTEAKSGIELGEEHFRELVEGASLAALTAGPDGTVLHANDAARELLAMPAERVGELRLVELLPDDELGDGEAELSSLVWLKRCDGTSFQAEVELRVLPSREDQLSVLTFVEATGTPSAAEEHLRSQQMEAVGRLAGAVAHDFNNLLTVINHCGDLLREGFAEGDARLEHVSELMETSERAAGLSSRLMRLARAGGAEALPVDLNSLVTGAEPQLRELLGESVEFELAIDPSLGQVSASPAHLERALLDLVANASEALASQGRASIETRRPRVDEALPEGVEPEGWFVLSVRDDGPGMSEGTKARALEPFFTTKRPSRGAGLGLALVHDTINEIGGRVSIETEKEGGTCVSLYLPACDEERQASERVAAMPSPAEAAFAALVVDDDELVRRVTCSALRRSGFRVHEAEDADDALAIAEAGEEQIDLLVTDVCMPGMSGTDLAAAMRWHLPELRVLLTSGRPPGPEVNVMLQGGDCAFVSKPFQPLELGEAGRRLAESGLAAKKAKGKSTIVVIDDEEKVRQVLRRMLESAGHVVQCAANGLEGLELVREGGCDLVITDLVMPVREGLETCRDLAREYPDLPVIATSGAPSGSAYLRLAGSFGARETLSKPLRKELVLAAIDRALTLA